MAASLDAGADPTGDFHFRAAHVGAHEAIEHHSFVVGWAYDHPLHDDIVCSAPHRQLRAEHLAGSGSRPVLPRDVMRGAM